MSGPPADATVLLHLPSDATAVVHLPDGWPHHTNRRRVRHRGRVYTSSRWPPHLARTVLLAAATIIVMGAVIFGGGRLLGQLLAHWCR